MALPRIKNAAFKKIRKPDALPDFGDQATFVFSEHKGGVGKTTFTFHLTELVNSIEGAIALAVDFDPQTNLTESILANDPDFLFDSNTYVTAFDLVESGTTDEGDYDINPILKTKELYRNKRGIYLIPSSRRFKDMANKGDIEMVAPLINLDYLKKRYNINVICIDAPADVGWIAKAAMFVSDYCIIPTTPEPYAVTGMISTGALLNEVNAYRTNPTFEMQPVKLLGTILNKVVKSATSTEKNAADLSDDLKDAMFENTVYNRLPFSKSAESGLPVWDFVAGGSFNCASEMMAATLEVLDRAAKCYQTNTDPHAELVCHLSDLAEDHKRF